MSPKVLFLDDDTIRIWYRLYREDAFDGLATFGYDGSACRLSDQQQDKLKAWITETGAIGAWVEKELGISYESRSGLVALLHRLGMEHRKPKTVSSKLDPDKLAAFMEHYENLPNQIGDDEAVLFGDAVHPTHASRPVGCWAPKDLPVAVSQSSGRQRRDWPDPNDRSSHGGRGQHDHVAARYRGDVSGQATDPSVGGQYPLPPRPAGAGLAGAAGVPDQAAFHPHLLPTPGSDRAAMGIDAQACHA
jgi:transposase